ncbi:hypothetical protein [Actinomyces sp.]|uniref:hypothetical protein n=1 Tax=Actinomyces sp. TaxID=29317 RepID=UPI00290AA790|nr:hypothetical protein [Actinomyces sp.]MDU7239828.1 hypothetical protein [Actinomyces sp.]
MSTDLVKAEAQQLDAYIRNAEKLAGASLLPAQYQRQPANILLAIQTGAPLGFTAMQSIHGIHVIKGKPTMSADMTAAAVRRAGHKLRITGDDTHAVAVLIRSDDPEFEYRCEWTLDRAKKAGLLGNDTWAKYPAAMLRARAITEVARAGASEALYGVVYTPEELGAEVDEDGAVIDVEPAPKPARPLVDDKTLSEVTELAGALGLKSKAVLEGVAYVTGGRERVQHLEEMSQDAAIKLIAYMRSRLPAEQENPEVVDEQQGVIDAEIVEDGESNENA